MDVGKNPVGGIDVVSRDVLPDFVEICLKASSPSIGLTRPVLRSSWRLSSVFRTKVTSSRYPARASSTMSSGARPLVVARSFSLFAVSAVTCTSMRPLYGVRPRPASSRERHVTRTPSLFNALNRYRNSGGFRHTHLSARPGSSEGSVYATPSPLVAIGQDRALLPNCDPSA